MAPTASAQFETGTETGAPFAPASSGVNEGNRAYAITSFVLGIASIVAGWTFIAPIIGFTLGMIALRRGTTERTLALWGTWMNGIILAFAAIGVLIVAALVGAGILTLPFFLM
ncbi:DUF4190 domain-containing protein [Leucobacter insecticola]|uniref:DUF4190 domain-containing protein n=1 Tax=Leucobacter insecticola TaxID=2714934 RepID=A0A6G8FI10_9MICO|nr:DUF4190 domain-containing protein [Leucobacter insecticola]QIM16005.1 DUF4190 domain-containing protein [Leucobacter insecticola]